MARRLQLVTHRWLDGYRVEVPDYWDDLQPEMVHGAYNGCGPDWFPGWLRWGLTWLSSFPVPTMVHDLEWAYDKSWPSLSASNIRWWRNCGSVIRRSLADLPPDLAIVAGINWHLRRIVYTLAVWAGAIMVTMARRLAGLHTR
jgi:hypothetical protein